MAELINLAGTTSHSFTIGEDGVTTYHGNIEPAKEVGKPGDIYIQDTTEIEDEHGIGTGVFRPFGKVYMKLSVPRIINNVETFVDEWSPVKNLEFDTPIISGNETTQDISNIYKVKLQNAQSPTTAASSTKATDYDNNHDSFGVTRFGTDAEVTVSTADKNTLYNNYKSYSISNLPTVFTTSGNYMPDKYIAVTPAQLADNLTVEMTRAIKVEGNLTALAADGDLANSTSLSDAIHREYGRATGAESNLQSQIDAITSKSDVADIVQVYDRGSDTSKTDIVHYNTTPLYDNDVVKVLVDETHNDAVSYYRWNWTDPTDHTQGGTWTYIGSVEAYYTKDEADNKFVRKTGNYAETITGVKTFNNNDLKVQSTSIDSTNTSTAGFMHLGFYDTNNVETGHIKSELTNDNKIISTIGSSRTINSTTYSSQIHTVVESDGTAYALAPSPAASNATTSNNKVATVEWTNDPAKSTNVVHRTGTEIISGSKDMTGATVTVATQARGDNSTKAASTAFVADGLSLKQDTIQFTTSDAKKCYAVNQAGTALEWRVVKDISTVDDLEDTVIANKANDESLVWDTSAANGAGAWVNKRPMVATILYW